MKDYEDEAFDEPEKAQQRKVATGVTDGSLPVQKPEAVKKMLQWADGLKRLSDQGRYMNIPSELSAGTCWQIGNDIEQFVRYCKCDGLALTPPAAQPESVQEPVAIPEYVREAAKHLHENGFEPAFMVRAIVGWINDSPPAAQPAPVQEPVALRPQRTLRSKT